MNILFLRGFNNYFNRTVKMYTTLDDYKYNSTSYLDYQNINFNPNDGVATELIIGNTEQVENSDAPLNFDAYGAPDYAVCYEGTNTIKSRWFILESERTRAGQYRIALKRDVLADYFDDIIFTPCFVEKGIISEENPLVFNKENMTYNQIKTQEIFLRDESQVPWIVGYVPTDLGGSQETAYSSFSVTFNSVGGIAASSRTLTRGLDVSKIELSWTVGDDVHKVVATPYTTDAIFYGFQATYTPDYSTSNGRIQYRVDTGVGPTNGTGTITIYINNPIPISGYVNRALSDEIVNSAIEASELPWTFTPSATTLGVLDSWIEHYSFLNRIDGGAHRNIVVDLSFTVTDHTINNRAITPEKSVQTGSKSYSTITSPETTWRYYSTKNGSGDGDFSTYGDYNALKALFTRGAFNTTQVMYNFLANRGIDIYNGDISTLPSYNEKYVHYNNKYYKIYVTPPQSSTSNIIMLHSGDNGFSSMQTVANWLTGYSSTGVRIYAYSNPTATLDLQYYYRGYTITAQEVSTNTAVSTNFPSDGVRPHLADAPYDMFAIPYGVTNIYKNGQILFQVDPDVSMFIASSISTTIGSQKVYDLQLVPYCPFREFIDTDGEIIDLTGYVEDKSYNIVNEITTAGISTAKSVILWGSRSNISFDLYYQIPIPQYDTNQYINKKMVNETTLYRLCSPNYSGQFEFSVAKNNGVLKFNVDLTYKPFNPYIHINPQFAGLYGTDWNDARGLICGGDFSLPLLTSAWANYQVSNKNYQEIFDRQIQNMDVNNQLAQEQLGWSKITGALTGGIGGAVGGALAGAKAGPYGAIAGAVVGGVGGTALSLIGGEKDQDWLNRQQAEAKSYSIDMYGYQLGNIQAMPYSLTKTSALTYNNKLFPILERYECTQTERNALRNKIKYEGMTIMAIGEIGSYLESPDDLAFFKGRLIRIESLIDDFHIADALYQEVEKGFYIPQS